MYFALSLVKFDDASSVYDHFDLNQLRLLRDHPRHFWRSRKNRFRHVMNTLHDCVKNRSFFQVKYYWFFFFNSVLPNLSLFDSFFFYQIPGKKFFTLIA